jgi:hypothetical protein
MSDQTTEAHYSLDDYINAHDPRIVVLPDGNPEGHLVLMPDPTDHNNDRAVVASQSEAGSYNIVGTETADADLTSYDYNNVRWLENYPSIGAAVQGLLGEPLHVEEDGPYESGEHWRVSTGSHPEYALDFHGEPTGLGDYVIHSTRDGWYAGFYEDAEQPQVVEAFDPDFILGYVFRGEHADRVTVRDVVSQA